jgi:hypothetical protein
MSSVTRFLKQIPVDIPYFTCASGTVFNIWVPNGNASVTPYVSGAAAGSFTTTTISAPTSGTTSTNTLLRDMGKTIVSSGRTFRRVQVLTEDLTGSTAWTAGPNGVWQASVEGVQLGSDAGDALYRCYYVEVGWRGVGTPQPVTRYG